MKVERHLSRKVILIRNGFREEYALSEVELTKDASGKILNFTIKRFEQETEGVMYHDADLIIEEIDTDLILFYEH